jgi:tRNA-dihydrouridine synthase
MYEGRVDLDAFEAVFCEIKHPVCYNGDIAETAFFMRLRQRFCSIERFMLGRGLLANPFLCEQIRSESGKGGSPEIERVLNFHNDLLGRYEDCMQGDRPVLGKMKELWSYLSLHLSNGRKLFKKVRKAQHLAAYHDIVNEQLSQARWKTV